MTVNRLLHRALIYLRGGGDVGCALKPLALLPILTLFAAPFPENRDGKRLNID